MTGIKSVVITTVRKTEIVFSLMKIAFHGQASARDGRQNKRMPYAARPQFESNLCPRVIMKTVLWVDEEQESLKTHQTILAGLGYKVIPEQNSLSALSLVENGVPIDLVITEYRFREMTGLDLFSSLQGIIPSVPVIMLTAYASIESYLLAVNCGVFEYVNKPVRAGELARIVAAAFERRMVEVQPGAVNCH